MTSFVSFYNYLNDNIKNLSSIHSIKDKSILLLSKNTLTDITYNILLPLHIFELNDIIGIHNNNVNYIKELSNGLFISGSQKKLIVYNNSFKREYEISINNNYIYEIKNIKNDYIEVLICSDESIKLLKIQKNYDYSIREYKEIEIRVCFQFNNDFIICNKKGIFQINDFLSFIKNSNEQEIINKSYWNGIKLNCQIIALTSNKYLLNGEDKILFFNNNSRHVVKSIENYSFSLSQNNLVLMSIEGIDRTTEKDDKNKILLCGCKKYKEGQKNGILSLKLDLKDNFNILSQTFYETKNFEVYCLCPIFNIEKDIFIFNKKPKRIETEYFLVGGFNPKIKQGLIKLYKVNYNKENFENTEIEYIKDIEIKSNKRGNKFDGFEGNITCIIQSKYNGNILITCSDGKVYSFKNPNINLSEN